MPKLKRAKKKVGNKANRKTKTTKKKAAHPKQMEKVAAKAELKYVSWDSIEMEDLNPSIQRQFMYGQNVMLARLFIKKGGLVPLHSHYHEQVAYIVKGALKFTIDGRDIVVRAGEVLIIPPHMPHSAEALEDTEDVDIFNPPREDWINKTDQYLRNVK